LLASPNLCASPGGAGSAAFASTQAAFIVLPLTGARPARLLTVCTGTGPLAILLVGTPAKMVGPLQAVDVIELMGLLATIAASIVWRSNEARATPMTLRAVMEEPR
jgi:hypothetical protein